MSNEELNRKLAEWRGFKYCPHRLAWVLPEDAQTLTHYIQEFPPDFTDPVLGIAHCFKWLVPEVYEKYGEVKTRELLEVWGWYVASGAYWGKEALALCLAIEKLIDNKQ